MFSALVADFACFGNWCSWCSALGSLVVDYRTLAQSSRCVSV
ncbi:hypothetical protein HMPREF1584_00011 [Gardnerella vaginalis JCP8481A]|nr:hypothetical protein HMPREF1585_01354 [Gardnerella vaginalis JCP8481B]EPI44957.1 hypothetical protein HMPREF1584_00011 [Gardnerella vaginalis JCP8481A]